MLKDLVARWDNNGGGASITIPRNDDQQTSVDIIGDTGWTIRAHANGIDKYLYHPNPPDGGTISFRMDVDPYTVAGTKATPGDASPGTKYLGEGSYIDLDNDRMEAVASQIRSANNLDGNLSTLTPQEKWEVAQDAFMWAPQNMTYTGMSSNQGSSYAFDYEKGDCTEFAASAVALLRENGIPARVITAWWAGTDGVQGETNFPNHHRFEVYLPDNDSDSQTGEGHWILMDNQLYRSSNTYKYGFGFGDDDSINLGVSADGTWTHSSLTDMDYWIQNAQ
jgi:transglutaminase-like putative cysteine protease